MLALERATGLEPVALCLGRLKPPRCIYLNPPWRVLARAGPLPPRGWALCVRTKVGYHTGNGPSNLSLHLALVMPLASTFLPHEADESEEPNGDGQANQGKNQLISPLTKH
jgi:hypothetical protein